MKRMSEAPVNLRGDEHWISIYVAIMARSEQLKVRNRSEFQMEGDKKTTCIVVTGMLSPEKWGDPQELSQLQQDMLEWCREFGEVEACVLPPSSTSIWAHQIFVTFKDPIVATKALRHFHAMQLEHGVVVAEVAQRRTATSLYASPAP